MSHALSGQPSLKSFQTDDMECSHWLSQDLDQAIWVHFLDQFELMEFCAAGEMGGPFLYLPATWFSGLPLSQHGAHWAVQ